MANMNVNSIAPMADRHLVAAELLKQQTCQKFTTKSDKELSTENRTDKLINIFSAQTIASGSHVPVSQSQFSRSFRSLNARRTAVRSSSAPTMVDRKEKLMKMYSLAPNCQKIIQTMNNAQQNNEENTTEKYKEKKRGFWRRSKTIG